VRHLRRVLLPYLKASLLIHKTVNIIILLCLTLAGFSQENLLKKKQRYPYLQLNYRSGSFWSRSDYLDKQFSAPYKAVEARFVYQLIGKKQWQQYHRYPKYGFGIHYSDLVKDRSDTVVGNPISFFSYYSSPLARFGRFTLAADMSVGLSYTGLIYDPVENPYNDVIASHINLYFDMNLNLNVDLSRRIGLNAAYGLTHYSNGRIHMPQKGVNNWGWIVGANYLLKKPAREFIYMELPEFMSSESVQLMLGAGSVEGRPRGTNMEMRFFTFSFTADYAYQFSPKGALTFGLDVLYDGSLERAIKGMHPEDVTMWQQMYLGSHLGYHFIVDRFTVLLNVGTYFRQSSFDRGYYFARAGGRYRITDHFSVQVSIKSKNGIRSDWIEWGFAYSFKIR